MIVIVNGKMILYGLDNINKKLDNIIESLKLEKQCFEIKLIMYEAITNAFIHGNNSDMSKPICVEWEKAENFVCISVKNSVKKVGNLEINKNIEKNMFKESGRGLYIISSYADEVKFEDDSIIMKKIL